MSGLVLVITAGGRREETKDAMHGQDIDEFQRDQFAQQPGTQPQVVAESCNSHPFQIWTSKKG